MKILNKFGIEIFEVKGDSLSMANLRGANLRGADLYGANLRGADLYWANLRGADLYGADLYGANLRGANLRGADLYGANLRGAKLYGADLYWANLRDANLIVIYASRHTIISQVSGVTIGCESHPLDWWLENYQELGEENDYTQNEIVEYGRLLKALVK